MEFPIVIHILHFAKITKFPQNHSTVSSEIAIHLVTITLIKICHVFYRIHPFTKKKKSTLYLKNLRTLRNRKRYFSILSCILIVHSVYFEFPINA